jgi:multidrug efflux pump
MFREFALTLTIAVVVSAIVSLTLTPMMCGRVLRPAQKHRRNRLARPFHRAIDRSVETYHTTLAWVLRHERLTLTVTLITLVATIGLYVVVPKGFLPQQDNGLITAVCEAGPDVSFAEMRRLQLAIAEEIRRDPEVTGVVAAIGVSTFNPTPNTGHLMITLKPRAERSIRLDEIIDRLQRSVAAIPGMIVYFQPVQDIQLNTQSSRAKYQYTLSGTEAQAVADWSVKLADRLRAAPGLREVTSAAQAAGLRAYINFDREKAGRLGISMQVVNDTLNDAFAQRQISTIYAQANQYRVILEAMPQYQEDPNSLSKLFVPSTNGSQVPISTFTTIQRTIAPLTISHEEQFPATTISFNLAPGAALSDAVAAISKAQRDIGMPTSIVGRYSGDAGEFGRSLAGEPWLILAAVITIYIVLGVLYESFIHPLTILSTLPSAGVGALLALMLTQQDMSVVALIGIVLLMGIVKKNAIMMIDFALEAERTNGLSPHDSIVKAAMMRFRPIMMTTLAALFGALPLLLARGTGSELRFPLGVTIIGGLLLSQLLTLYTTPVIYLFMERLRARLWRVIAPTLAPAHEISPPVLRQRAAE